MVLRFEVSLFWVISEKRPSGQQGLVATLSWTNPTKVVAFRMPSVSNKKNAAVRFTIHSRGLFRFKTDTAALQTRHKDGQIENDNTSTERLYGMVIIMY